MIDRLGTVHCTITSNIHVHNVVTYVGVGETSLKFKFED